MTIDQKLAAAKLAKKNFWRIGMDVLAQTSDAYLDQQRDQMKHGLKADGTRIGVYASDAYEREKRAMNPLADGYVDLEYEGDFKLELTLRPLNTKRYTVYSQDWKNAELITKYGAGIFLLSPEYLDKYRRNSFYQPFKTKLIDTINGISN